MYLDFSISVMHLLICSLRSTFHQPDTVIYFQEIDFEYMVSISIKKTGRKSYVLGFADWFCMYIDLKPQYLKIGIFSSRFLTAPSFLVRPVSAKYKLSN